MIYIGRYDNGLFAVHLDPGLKFGVLPQLGRLLYYIKQIHAG